MSSFDIETKTFTTQTDVSRFTVEVNNIVLFASASFRVNLYTAGGSYYTTFIMDLTDEEYNAWGNDDGYIRDLVATRYGFTLKA